MADDNDIAAHVRAFIAERVDSVAQLEVLLLLHARPDRGWTARDVAAELRIDPNWAERQLAELPRRALAAASGESYRYAPATAELADAVAGLAKAYAERRVTVINLIFSRPADTLRSFADAFRLRKDKPDG